MKELHSSYHRFVESCSVTQALKDAAAPGGQDPYILQQAMRRVIGRWVARRLHRRPMIVPVVTEQ